MAAIAGVGFDCAARAVREQAVGDRLRQPPGAEARQELGLAPQTPPVRWSLRTIRAAVAAVADYSLSGACCSVSPRGGRRRATTSTAPTPTTSPRWRASNAACVRRCAPPQELVLLFLDEMGSSRWPARACDWMLAGPGVAASRLRKAGPTNRPQRLIGALNALSGQVDYLDT
jgi:hypothetical protein